MKKLVVPKFASDSEEAQWWDDHAEIVEDNLFEALRNGTAQRGTAVRLMREGRLAQDVALRAGDLERARKLSEIKKVDFQAYVQTLLHKALDREEAALKRARRRKSA